MPILPNIAYYKSWHNDWCDKNIRNKLLNQQFKNNYRKWEKLLE